MKIDSYAALHKICVGAQRETEHIYKIRPSAVTSDLFLIVSTVCSLLDFICHLLIGGSLCNTVTLNSQPAVYHTIGTWSILIHLKEAMVVLCGGERSGSILKRGIVSASCTVKRMSVDFTVENCQKSVSLFFMLERGIVNLHNVLKGIMQNIIFYIRDC